MYEKSKPALSPAHQLQSSYSKAADALDNSTVEAVKKKLINDPQYRRELLQRVLPQFSKLNEHLTGNFLNRFKADASSSQSSIQTESQNNTKKIAHHDGALSNRRLINVLSSEEDFDLSSDVLTNNQSSLN